MNTVRRTCPPPPSGSRFSMPTNGAYVAPPLITQDQEFIVSSEVQQSCNPWGSLVRCPLYIYIALSIIGFYITWQSLLGTKDGKSKSTKGSKTTQGKTPRESASIVGLVLYSVIAIIFGMIIYNQCKKCDNTNAWFWLIIALLAPFIIVALVLGILSFVYGFAIGWSGTKNAKKSGKGKA